LDWYDFYREDGDKRTLLGEGYCSSATGLRLQFELPDVPTIPEPCEGMPINPGLAREMVCASVLRERKFGWLRLPRLGYWIYWERKAVQQELAL
jgi:hypothetical protein